MLDNFRKNLASSSPRAKIFLVCIVLDIAFLALMATSGAGPLSNPSIYWGKYSSATVAGVSGDLTTGIWGDCRTSGLTGRNVCFRWSDDPVFYAQYGTYGNAASALQVISGVIMFFGGISLAFLNPIPLVLCSVAATLFYIPTFGITTWIMTDIGKYVSPYSSYSTGPGFGCGAAALALCLLSTLLKAAGTRARSDGEIMETANNAADVYKY